MSRVDVVIPCYKYAHYLRGCVESVLKQPGVETRCLIIDDCSPDNTPEVAAALVAEYPGRVEYRRHAVNRGHIATYNEGLLGWADGEYCLLLSADDMLTPCSLRRAKNLMDAHPEVGLAYGRDIKTSRPGVDPCPSGEGDRPWKVMTGPQFIEESCRQASNIVPTPAAVVRTSVQKAVGGYRKELPHSGDMEMWLRIAAHASVGVIDAEQAYYRTHPTQMSVGYAGVKDLKGARAAFQAVFTEHAGRIPDCDGFRRMADRNLASVAFWTASHAFDAGRTDVVGEYLAYALELDPQIRRRPMWWRFLLKRVIGQRVWAAVRPVARLARGRGGRVATA